MDFCKFTNKVNQRAVVLIWDQHILDGSIIREGVILKRCLHEGKVISVLFDNIVVVYVNYGCLRVTEIITWHKAVDARCVRFDLLLKSIPVAGKRIPSQEELPARQVKRAGLLY